MKEFGSCWCLGHFINGKRMDPLQQSALSFCCCYCLFIWNCDNSGPDETVFRASGLQQFPVKQKPFKVNKEVSVNEKKEIRALKLH